MPAGPKAPELTSRPLMLSPLPTAPSCAREVSRLQLAEWGMSALSEVADIIVTELVTNATQASRRHGVPAQLGFRMSVSGPRIRIEVWDTAPGCPRLTTNVPAVDESGRGLQLVDALSGGRWGTQHCPAGGKVVWAQISC
jgi:anti-sigma regulatory factor (Ser/Thr protein kinase)